MSKLRPHTRIKPKAGAAPTAEERRHWDRIAHMGCLVCGQEAEIHHVHSDGFKRIGKSHRRVAPLCVRHHRTGQDAVHTLSHAGFTERFKIDLLSWADEAWKISQLGA